MSFWNRQGKVFRSCLNAAQVCFREHQHSVPAGQARYCFTTAHFTQRERCLYWEHIERNSRSPRLLVAQEPSRPYPIPFYSYDARRSEWVPSQIETQTGKERDCVLTVISWNIDAFSPDPNARATAILSHLEEACEDTPRKTVIMFQEVCQGSLNAILGSPWAQQHFKLSNVAAPESIYANVAGASFIMERLHWEATSYFTLMMVSNDLTVLDSFRVPFTTQMGRDALAADIWLKGVAGPDKKRGVVRLCTTHLESLYDGRVYRPGQLAVVSALLRHDAQMGQNVVAGLVAGDMNAIDKSEHEYPKADDVRLQDAWESGPEEAVSNPKRSRRDFTNGQARGNTWGYQRASGKRDGKRMDKILYTGFLEYVPLSCGEQLTRGMKRLGVDLKTTVEAYMREEKTSSFTRSGKITSKTATTFHSLERIEISRQLGLQFAKDAARTTTTASVSDHYGILAEFRTTAALPNCEAIVLARGRH